MAGLQVFLTYSHRFSSSDRELGVIPWREGWCSTSSFPGKEEAKGIW